MPCTSAEAQLPTPMMATLMRPLVRVERVTVSRRDRTASVSPMGSMSMSGETMLVAADGGSATAVADPDGLSRSPNVSSDTSHVFPTFVPGMTPPRSHVYTVLLLTSSRSATSRTFKFAM